MLNNHKMIFAQHLLENINKQPVKMTIGASNFQIKCLYNRYFPNFFDNDKKQPRCYALLILSIIF